MIGATLARMFATVVVCGAIVIAAVAVINTALN